jgi:hypothetical protein
MTQGHVHYTVRAYSESRKPCQTPKPRLRQAHGSVRFFYFHPSHSFFSKAGCGKLMARYLQFFGKFDLIKSALYTHTEKKPTHCVSQQVGQQVFQQFNDWLASCVPQRPLRVAASVSAHCEKHTHSPRVKGPRISQADARYESSSQKSHGSRLTTSANIHAWCSPAIVNEISGGSNWTAIPFDHQRQAQLTGGITEAHLCDVPPFSFCDAIKKPPATVAF